jgi:hypothetical protein
MAEFQKAELSNGRMKTEGKTLKKKTGVTFGVPDIFSQLLVFRLVQAPWCIYDL